MFRVLLACLMLLGCSADTPFQPPTYNQVVDYSKVTDGGDRYGTTDDNGEMVACLTTVYQPDYLYFPVYAIRVSFKAGQIVKAYAEFEVTNDARINIMVASQILLVKQLDYFNPHKIEVTEGNGFNVDPTMHHGLTTKIGSVLLTDDFEGYLVLFAWAASDANPNTSLAVERDYGKLQYLVY